MSPTLADSFRILDIPPSASAEEAQQAFRIQMKKWHPDNYHSVPQEMLAVAAKKSAEINAAYECIQAELEGRTVGVEAPVSDKPEARSFTKDTAAKHWEKWGERVQECELNVLINLWEGRTDEGLAAIGNFRACNPNAPLRCAPRGMKEDMLVPLKLERLYMQGIFSTAPSLDARFGEYDRADVRIDALDPDGAIDANKDFCQKLDDAFENDMNRVLAQKLGRERQAREAVAGVEFVRKVQAKRDADELSEFLGRPKSNRKPGFWMRVFRLFVWVVCLIILILFVVIVIAINHS